jgi:hypothetical protein
VYASPDTIERGRALAALVKGNTMLLPLRAMFEAMGATVLWNGATKTATVSKPGAVIKVTVGHAIVWINSDKKPLDVAPRIYRGSVVVPVRVISEGLGAYVQWVPEKHSVVVRYLAGSIPAPPPPTRAPAPPAPTSAPSLAPSRPIVPPPAPTTAPTMAPTRAPSSVKPSANEVFVAADYLVSPKAYNELSPGNAVSNGSFAVQGAAELFTSAKVLIESDFRRYQYAHVSRTQTGVCPIAGDPGCVSGIGTANLKAANVPGQGYVKGLLAQEPDVDVHVAVKIFDPRVYVGAGYYRKWYNYLNYPSIGGVGAGITKLPDLEQRVSFYGSAWYYPSVTGTYTYPTSASYGTLSGKPVQLGYSVLKYQAGATINLGRSGFFLKAGWTGESATAKTNAPVGTQVSSPFVGAGFRFGSSR